MTPEPPRPPGRRGVWVFLAAVTALVTLLPIGLQAWGRTLHRTRTSVQEHHRPIREVQVDAGEAEVTIGPGPADRVRVHQTLGYVLSDPRVRQSVAGDVLIVKFECDDSALDLNDECEGQIDLRVPPGVGVRAAVSSGRIAVRDLHGPLRLQAASGLLEMAEVRGDVWAEADSGMIKGTGLASPELTARVDSGALRLAFTRPPRRVEAKSGSGPIRVTVPPGSYYRVDARSESSDTRVDTALHDPSSERYIRATSGSGPVRVLRGDLG
ncbi:DUF4097 family beta strand repeat-containing protein [Spirillospora sp. CA-294931]|uniref:DUF4097 family beta strand repeat-containing protein n=1 Tax=Spirillospora sp. CA-294931 TaxID=3240042 RepID=UPI003D90306B